MKEFNELINKEETDINRELYQRHLNIQRPSKMLKIVYTTNDKKENNKLVDVIKSGLKRLKRDLKNEIEKMSENEKIIKQPNKIVNIVEKIFELNRQNQVGKMTKILAPDQMLKRLPIRNK